MNIRVWARRGRRSAVAALLIAALTGCAGTDMTSLLSPTPEPAVAAAPPAPEPPPAPPASGRNARAARAPAPAAPEPSPAARAAPQQTLTAEEINTECWMRSDANPRLRDIDARLKWVQGCVAERTKGR